MHRHRRVPHDLRRRIIVWFGLTILAGLGSAVTIFSLLGSPQGHYRQEGARLRRVLGDSFATVWHDETARTAMAEVMADDLEAQVVLHDLRGQVVVRKGPECTDRRTSMTAVVTAPGGAELGRVDVCLHRRKGPGGAVIAALLASFAVIWGIAGLIARRLTRPLYAIAQHARALGDGHLDSRVHVPRAYREVHELGEVLNDMATRIERQLRDQRELLAAVSHEIRTPLSRIRLLTELIREGQTSRLDEIDREVDEIDLLVGELLASSRLDFSALTRRPLDAVDLAKRALDRAGLPLDRLEVQGELPHLEGDATLLGRALANLIENAERHGGGLTTLRVAGREGRVAFEAEDAGPGIAPGDESRIFESFYQRAGQAVRDKGSLGLGLTLVRRIAEAHGGSSFARNRADGGALVGIEVSSGA